MAHHTLFPNLLKKSGFNNLKLVDSQMNPDGNFTNVNSSNPEDSNSLSQAIDLATLEKVI